MDDINPALFMPPPRRASKSLVAGIVGGFGLIVLSAVVVAGVLLSSYSRTDASPAALGASLTAAAAPQPQAAALMVAPTAPEAAAPAAAPANSPVEQVKKATPSRRHIAHRARRHAAKTAAARPTKRPDAALRKLLGI